MANEIEILEKYIDDNYKSKALFAKALDMTPQNLNHHIRAAKKTENKFSLEFKSKLHYLGFSVFEKPTSVKLIEEPEILLELLNTQKETIRLQKQKIQELEEQLKAPVVKVRKTGG